MPVYLSFLSLQPVFIMKVQYCPDVEPLRKEQSGFVFQSSRTVDCVTSSKKNDRYRRPAQNLRRVHLLSPVRRWRDLSATSQNAWSLFAATLPQPCKFPESGFLSGYQCFVRRNYFKLLNEGLHANLMLNPSLVAVSSAGFDFTVSLQSGRLIVTPSFSRLDNSVVAQIFISSRYWQPQQYQNSQSRFMCSIPNVVSRNPNFGALYNWWAINDVRGFCPSGWHIITYPEAQALVAAFGGSPVAGIPLRESGTAHWQSGNIATGSAGLNLVGANRRNADGLFTGLKTLCDYHINYSNPMSPHQSFEFVGIYNQPILNIGQYDKRAGRSVFYVRDAPPASGESESTVTGNDGHVYPAKAIAGMMLTTKPSIETKFRDGSNIPLVVPNAEWSALGTAGMCYPQNLESNAWSVVSSQIDITENYVNRFGLVPVAGDRLLCHYFEVSQSNGQFFTPVNTQKTVIV